MAEERIKGKRTPTGKTKWIACIELTEWQKEKLLEVCVSMTLTKKVHNGKVYEVAAVEVDPTVRDFEQVLTEENIRCVRHGA